MFFGKKCTFFWVFFGLNGALLAKDVVPPSRLQRYQSELIEYRRMNDQLNRQVLEIQTQINDSVQSIPFNIQSLVRTYLEPNQTKMNQQVAISQLEMLAKKGVSGVRQVVGRVLSLIEQINALQESIRWNERRILNLQQYIRIENEAREMNKKLE